MTRATGRVALVTGASSGIGAATARLLAERGMRVVVNYLHSAKAAGEVVADIEAAGGQAMAVQADVREAAAVEAMTERVRAAWGGVDVLVHNALTPYAIKPFQDMTSRLTSGIPWVALNVNTHRPLFWFLARPGLTSLTDLAGRRLAVHAPHTAPGCFARIVLRRAGLDPDRDVHCVIRSPGDYGMDLRQLHDGGIDAAFVGSTMAPEAVAAEHGWRVLAWVGDHFQIPTVGVAVDTTHIQPDDPAVRAVVRAHRRALQVIRNDPDTTVRYLQAFLGRHTAGEARVHYETFIAPHFTTDGRADLAVAATAIAAVATELGVPATITSAEFYRTTP